MKLKKISFALTISLLTIPGFVSAAYAPQQQYQGYASYVPAGTPVTVSISQALGSGFTKPGETFVATLSSPLSAGGTLIAPAGSQVQGTVVSVEPGGRGGRAGTMDLRLTNVITPNGRMIPLSASLDQASFELKADGGRTSHLVKTTAVGAGAGALSGLVGGAISGGRKGQATAIGTGIGAGVGLLGGAFQKGKDITIDSGTSLPFILDQPVQASGAAPQVQQYAPQGGYPGGNFSDPTTGGGQYYQTQPLSNPYLNP